MSKADPFPVVPRPRLIALPIFWQVMGLALAVLVLALGINTLVVLKAPEPPPSGYSLSEVITALKTGEAKLQNGHVLKAQTLTSAPVFVSHPETNNRSTRMQALQNLLALRLATELNVPADTITLQFAPRRTFLMHGPRNFDLPRPPPESAGLGDGPQHPPSEHNGAGANGERANIIYPSFSVAWKLKDDTWRVVTPPKTLIQPWQERLLLGFALTALLILPLAWLLSQRLSRPIIAFSEAAAKLSVEDDAPPVLSAGPREVRAAAEVLNAMQARIRKQMESRTALMGAIAHDLKTPLARMRLRIEDLPAPMRDKLGGDIAHMDGLIRSAMSFTSAHKMNETLRPLDLSSLVGSVNDDLGAVCTLQPASIEDNIMVRGDQVALKRIIINLVENAGRYARGCRIELASRGNNAELRIIDEGPGLPPHALEAVFEPFYRLESSRNRDTGGTGLGLSVARSLAEAQGGALTLSNRYAGRDIVGLEALLVLPKLELK